VFESVAVSEIEGRRQRVTDGGAGSGAGGAWQRRANGGGGNRDRGQC
jgi:hypothetical protein